MKRTMILLAAALVVIMTVTGCGNPASSPDPEQVVVSGVEFINVSNTTQTTGVYQWDGTGAYYTANGDVVVATLDAYSVTIGSSTFVNAKWVTGTSATVEPTSYFAGLGTITGITKLWMYDNSGTIEWAGYNSVSDLNQPAGPFVDFTSTGTVGEVTHGGDFWNANF